MIRTIHLRHGKPTSVVEAIRARMAAEGYEEGSIRKEELGATVPGYGGVGAGFDTSERTLVVIEDAEWISVLDHPHADTPWAELLAESLGVPAVELSSNHQDDDDSSFLTVALHERGGIAHVARMPDDVEPLDDDIFLLRPTFLSRVAPEAEATLASGVAVYGYGGEENVRTIGAALGIARPLVSSHEDMRPSDIVLAFARARPTR